MPLTPEQAQECLKLKQLFLESQTSLREHSSRNTTLERLPILGSTSKAEGR